MQQKSQNIWFHKVTSDSDGACGSKLHHVMCAVETSQRQVETATRGTSITILDHEEKKEKGGEYNKAPHIVLTQCYKGSQASFAL